VGVEQAVFGSQQLRMAIALFPASGEDAHPIRAAQLGRHRNGVVNVERDAQLQRGIMDSVEEDDPVGGGDHAQPSGGTSRLGEQIPLVPGGPAFHYSSHRHVSQPGDHVKADLVMPQL
jgi:hypothetical protein